MTVVYYPGKGMQGEWLAKSKDAHMSYNNYQYVVKRGVCHTRTHDVFMDYRRKNPYVTCTKVH